jgi:hypothetical protein
MATHLSFPRGARLREVPAPAKAGAATRGFQNIRMPPDCYRSPFKRTDARRCWYFHAPLILT